MKPIPEKLRDELSQDKFYTKCCLTGSRKNIKWHHAWIYKTQINEAWAIMPVTWRKHSPYGDEDSIHRCQNTKEYVQYLSLLRADLDDLCRRMPKKNWRQELRYLKNKYAKIDLSFK